MSDNIINITDLVQQFKDKAEVDAYCRQLYTTLQATLKEKEILKEKVMNLELMLVAPNPNKVEFVVNPEVAFIEMQLNRLKIRYADLDITDEDTKKLESLMRSLKIARDKNPPIKIPQKSTLPIEEAELIALAAEKLPDNGR